MQIPLPLPHRAAMDEADFMITASNQDAAAWINRWPDWPSHCLIVYGPAGSGKTHLAHMWARRSGAEYCDTQSGGIPSPSWGGLGRGASNKNNDKNEEAPLPAKTKELAEANSKFLHPSPQGGRTLNPNYALDNINAISGNTEHEESLFHLFNRTRDEKGFLLLTGSTPPVLWNILLPDLRSRLLAAQAVAIQFPDDALLGALLLKQFSDRQITLDENVVNYVLSRLERSASAVRDVVEKLDHASLSAGRKITVALTRDVLGDL
jgi:chromosomal replication initiation ATPase DnaA